jgi:predicted short-subunit dehydrogenase-like oxidoreductase (DUF2520 family)
MLTLNLVGCGRVGKTLARLWHTEQVVQIQDVLTTSRDSAARAVTFIGSGLPVQVLAQMRPADLWLIGVPDRQLALSALDMARAFASHTPAMAFHCSGAMASSVLAPLRENGWQVASAHCILSFADPASAVQQFNGTPCGIEGDAPLAGRLQKIFAAIGARCFPIEAENKLLYHAAAVFATNFLPVLQAVAEDLWKSSGVPPEMLPQLRSSLLRNAVDNLLALGPAGALTGPAARGDTDLVTRQAQALAQWDTSTANAYRALSELAARLAQAAQDTPPPGPHATWLKQ